MSSAHFRQKDWRMSCEVGELTERLPTSQLILQPIRYFAYVTANSRTLLLLLLRNRLFTYVTWRAAHVTNSPITQGTPGLRFVDF